MRSFFKDNIVLVVGAVLPIVVMLLFALATIIPAYFVAPPQYDLLFATGYFENNNGLMLQVVNGKLDVQYRCSTFCNKNNYVPQKLYLFETKTHAVQEINIVLPVVPPNSQSFAAPVVVPQLANFQIDPSLQAPDGYQWNTNRNEGGDLFGALFFGGYHNQLSISKNGNTIVIPLDGGRYNYYNVKFIGWVISRKGM